MNRIWRNDERRFWLFRSPGVCALDSPWSNPYSPRMQAATDHSAEPLPSAQALLPPKPPTPLLWRFAIAAGILAIGGMAWVLRDAIGPRGQAVAGLFCFFGFVAMF